jgi:hypothetical protein
VSLFNGRRSVPATADLDRIIRLPRRKGPEDADRLVREMTEILKKPDGTMTLRPVQAFALYEIAKYGGMFGPMRVGAGKTLCSLLTPFVCGSRRPVLLLPAALIEKTERERIQLDKHWRVAKDLRLISYESLGRVASAETLAFYKPDLIIADEAHRLKNKKAGVTRRVVRYMRENPGTKFVAMSGTMVKGGTIKAFAHILRWTHKQGAPVPMHEGELEEWAEALDEGGKDFARIHPGALLKLASSEDRVPGDDLRTARRAFHRRLVETPAVVSTGGDQVACSLYARALEYKPNPITDENFKILRETWATPDGWALSMAAEVWRVARELAIGLHYAWDPRPPLDWLNARREWAAFVRETLSHSRTLDTELQVALACADGKLPPNEYHAWKAIKDTFRPNSVPIWHDDAALVACEHWLKQGPGICWVEHTFFGNELEKRTGVPYFREGGLDKRGQSIEALAELIRTGKTKPTPIIASVAANSTGRNLQPWHRNLITSCPSGAATWEQLLGRTHRDGQTADTVEVDILLGCIEHAESYYKAKAEARMVVDTLGDSQKLLIADDMFPSEAEIATRRGPRWTKTKER